MLPLFRAGLGGVIGSGRQYVSWIALDEIPLVLLHALHCGDLSGPVNAVAPRPVTNREFTEALGKALSRTTPLPVPAFALRLAVGREMADALLLASARVVPRRLEETGYRFRFPELPAALRHLLGGGRDEESWRSASPQGRSAALFDFRVAQLLQHEHQRLGAVFPAPVGLQRHVHLVDQCQARQRELHAPRLLERDPHVLDEVLDEEAGIEVALHDPRGEVVERPAAGGAAADRRQHPLEIEARLRP